MITGTLKLIYLLKHIWKGLYCYPISSLRMWLKDYSTYFIAKSTNSAGIDKRLIAIYFATYPKFWKGESKMIAFMSELSVASSSQL